MLQALCGKPKYAAWVVRPVLYDLCRLSQRGIVRGSYDVVTSFAIPLQLEELRGSNLENCADCIEGIEF